MNEALYIAARSSVSFILSFFICSVAIYYANKFLPRFINFAQPERDYTPSAQEKSKRKILPIGGVIIFISFTLAMLMTHGLRPFSAFFPKMIFITAFVFLLIGFADDIIKVLQKNGLSGKIRLASEFIFVAGLLYYIHRFHHTGYFSKGFWVIPFYGIIGFYMPLVLAILVKSFAIVGTANAVNLTDGLDGLAGRSAFVNLIFLMILSVILKAQFFLTMLMPLAGALLGFLLFNSKPASIYMGDAGSLFLGAFISCTMVSMNFELALLFIGIVYLIEALSVIIQRYFFKFTKGKRFFKMAPFHHHLEFLEFTEEKIVSSCTIFTILGCVLAISSFTRI